LGLLRCLPNGKLDTGFGTNGVAQTGFGGAALAIEANGEYLVAGQAQTGPDLSQADFAVARLTTSGMLVAAKPVTANNGHSSGGPFGTWLPRSAKVTPVPATRSLTVRDTRISAGQRRHPFSDPDRVARYALVYHVQFAGMDADQDPNSGRGGIGHDRGRAADRLPGSIEHGQQAVRTVLDQAAPMGPDQILRRVRRVERHLVIRRVIRGVSSRRGHRCFTPRPRHRA